ncbi:O-antigen ligase family protein [Shewanella glacialipiscicola]|uniref:O-antigen ligase family protein n=3 Tax=Shewanella glacialipiscicola TaxID=614069 RepID=UPI00200D1040|nr:O-antigen ligase family protein [Shewanella glacialipiscicola]MCL1086348.1 O-antigen ligase family protein [Shewanella glacialipiscicola]
MPLRAYSWMVVIAFLCVFLLGTVFAVNFSHFIGVDNEYDIKRILVIGFIWFYALGLCFVKGVELVRVSTVSLLSLSLFFVLAIASAFASKHPFWGIVEIANNGLLITAFYLFTISMKAIQRDSLNFAVYVGILLFSILTLVKYILFLFFSYADTQSFDIHGLLSGYVNVRFFNQLQVMVVPLLLLPFFNQHLAKFKRISMVMIALHWVVLLQTEARGAMISLILALTILLYFVNAEARKKLVLLTLKTILSGIFLWLVFIVIIPYWLINGANFQIRTSSSGRLDLWLYVLQSISDSPLLGFGPMSFSWAEGKPLPNAHPHNSVMQLLYEYGIISCIVMIGWVMSRVYYRLRYLSQVTCLSQDTTTATIPVTYALLSGLVYSLFSGVMVMPFAQLMLVFVIAMQVQDNVFQFYKAGIWTKIILFLMVNVMTLVLMNSYKNEELLPALFPRVWLNGLIHY